MRVQFFSAACVRCCVLLRLLLPAHWLLQQRSRDYQGLVIVYWEVEVMSLHCGSVFSRLSKRSAIRYHMTKLRKIASGSSL